MPATLAAAVAGFALGTLVLGGVLVWQNHRWQQRFTAQTARQTAQLRREDALTRRLTALERQAAAMRPALSPSVETMPEPQAHAQRAVLGLFDAERLVELVQVQLRLGLPPERAIAVLTMVDNGLAGLETPAAVPARRALAHDLARLRAVSAAGRKPAAGKGADREAAKPEATNPEAADREAVAARLESVLRTVGTWRMLADTAHGALDLPVPTSISALTPALTPASTPASTPTSTSASTSAADRIDSAVNPASTVNPSAANPVSAASTSWEQRVRSGIQSAFGGLLRIQPVPTPDSVRLDPAQQEILRDRVRFELLDLQQAVLLYDGQQARIHAQSLQSLLQRYFDPRDPAVLRARRQIGIAAAATAAAAPPTLEETLAALRAAVRAGGR